MNPTTLGSHRLLALAGALVALLLATRTSTRWRVVYQGSDVPPCRLITARMARELGLGFVCDPRG